MKDKRNDILQIGGGKILLLLFFALISGRIWGDDATYSYVFDTSVWKVLGAQELNGVTWTLDGKYPNSLSLDVDHTKGQKMGSANNPFSYICISSEDIKDNIAEITVETSGASSVKATFQVTVGGESYVLDNGNTAQDLSSTTTAYTFSGASSGKVELIWNNSSAKAIYVRSITIICGEERQKVLPVDFSHADGFVSTVPFVLTASCPTDGATIYYTTNGENPTTASERFPEDGLTVSSTVTIKAIAVRDGVQSPVTTATYTKKEPVPTDGLTALVFEKDGLYYAAVNSRISNGVLGATEVDVVNGKALNPLSGESIGWYVDESAMTIKSPDNQYVAYSGTNTDLKWQASAYAWYDKTLAKPWHVQESKGSVRTLLYHGGTTNGVKAYAVSNTGNSGYSGEMQLMPLTDGYVRNITGVSPQAPKYGTICLPCDVAAGDFSGAVFHSVLGKVTVDGVVTAVALSEPLQTLKAGTPYIFSATLDRVLVAYTGETVAEPQTENGLVGALGGGCEVPEGKYLVSNNMIQICGAGCFISSNRAYLDFDLMSEYVPVAGTNARLITFDEVTGVNPVTVSGEIPVDVYRADGICVRRQADVKTALSGLPKGLYLVGGRKVIVK